MGAVTQCLSAQLGQWQLTAICHPGSSLGFYPSAQRDSRRTAGTVEVYHTQKMLTFPTPSHYLPPKLGAARPMYFRRLEDFM